MFNINWERLYALSDQDFMATLKRGFRVHVMAVKANYRQEECLYMLEEMLEYATMERDLLDLDKEVKSWEEELKNV